MRTPAAQPASAGFPWVRSQHPGRLQQAVRRMDRRPAPIRWPAPARSLRACRASRGLSDACLARPTERLLPAALRRLAAVCDRPGDQRAGVDGVAGANGLVVDPAAVPGAGAAGLARHPPAAPRGAAQLPGDRPPAVSARIHPARDPPVLHRGRQRCGAVLAPAALAGLPARQGRARQAAVRHAEGRDGAGLRMDQPFDPPHHLADARLPHRHRRAPPTTAARSSARPARNPTAPACSTSPR